MRLIRIVAWAGVAFYFLLIFDSSIIPAGKVKYKEDFAGRNYRFGRLTPHERVDYEYCGKKYCLPKLIGDPVYFSFYTPRSFDRATMTITYQREGDVNQAPVFEAGILADKRLWRYDLEPVENDVLERLALDWKSARDGRLVLFDKQATYKSLADLLGNPPPASEVAAYNYRPDFLRFAINNYRSDGESFRLPVPLRGAYAFYTYIKDEKLDFRFSFKDLNLDRNPDSIGVRVYYYGQMITEEILAGDGVDSDNAQQNALDPLELAVGGLPEGPYKIEVAAGDDIVTSELYGRQSKVAFENALWLFDAGKNKQQVKIFTDADALRLTTTDPAALGEVMINGEGFELAETYEQQIVPAAGNSLAEVLIEKPSLKIAGKGTFSFSKEAFFNPMIAPVSSEILEPGSGIKYVFADYVPPSTQGAYRKAELTLDLRTAYRENKRYNIMLSAPGLGPDSAIVIKEIWIECAGQDLPAYLKEKARSTYRGLKGL